jgi:hypothetical protein
MSTGPLPTGDCSNCGTALNDAFCSHCGQRVVSLRPTLHDLLHEGVHELVHFDGKIVKTLRLLIGSPGRLTREFLDGRRASYITPIRLYLVCSLLFFATVALLPARQWKVRVSNSSIARIEKGERAVTRNPALLAESFKHNLPRVAFLLMPLMALFVYALYRRAEPTYVPHLYFAVHYHAFFFILITAVACLTAIRSLWTMIPGLLLLLLTLPYLVVALRRVYGGTRLVTAAKGIVIWCAYVFAVLSAMTGLMLLTLWEAAA